jgi:hypothetical protein
LRILELWLQKASKNLISYELGIDHKTVYEVLNVVSKILIPRYYNSFDEEDLGGEDIIVEIDESKIGKIKYKRGHRVDGVWVLGII